ncbi:MAG: nucleotide exchange factor GrpE [Spirochaetales bacterium]|nr:nucleotide exchange factor GrpE [Spirochaetales bacterium]
MSKQQQARSDANEPSEKVRETASTAGPDASALEARIKELEGANAALQEELSSLKDQYLRKLADYENFRKRMFREKDDAVQYANSSLILDLIGVIDDFDRAAAAADAHGHDYAALHDGVKMIHTRLLGVLEGKYGLKRFDSAGQVFDPNLHEAIASETGDFDEPTVAEEFLAGYRLHDRVVRCAKVKVAMPDVARAEAGAPDEDATGEDR